jgi:hypothetical protein
MRAAQKHMQIEEYTAQEQAAAARAFNERLRARNQTEFLLDECPPGPEPAQAVIRNHHYLVQENGVVRGGFLLAAFPAVFGDGRRTRVLNAREPLSEALIDPKYGLLALRMLKFMEQQGPHLFALGMGSESRPFPRLLKGAQWRVSTVPFLFRVVRASRFLRELQMLQTPKLRRVLGGIAALSGAGKAALTLMQYRAAVSALSPSGLSFEPVRAWGDWVEEIWERCRRDYSFAISRNLDTVRELYPLDEQTRGYVVRRSGRPVGWISVRVTQMRDHPYFGNLRVATLLDGVALTDAMRASVTLASRALAQERADLLVTNQSHARWIAAFRGAGYVTGPSNYILALSKQLATEIATQPSGFDRMHFTRGDSDGRIHL